MKWIFVLCGFLLWGLFGWQQMGGATLARPLCPNKSSVRTEIQKITCATQDLRTAVQQDSLLKKLSDTNFFGSINPQDVVRSEESLSLFSQSLKQKIEETNLRYQESGRDNYTLSIASYPSSAKESSCSHQKTIDFDPTPISTKSSMDNKDGPVDEESLPRAHYTPLPNKAPRTFQIRTYKGQPMICENTQKSYQERALAYCGVTHSQQKKGSSGKQKKCIQDLTPSCLELDKKGAKKPSLASCVTDEEFGHLSRKFFMSNVALEFKTCPDDCSYYTQTVQAFYKNKNGKYCTDSYLIVHCGPKRKGSKYNLNIREINDLCRDFDGCQYL